MENERRACAWNCVRVADRAAIRVDATKELRIGALGRLRIVRAKVRPAKDDMTGRCDGARKDPNLHLNLLYAMRNESNGLELCFGLKMWKILEQMQRNRPKTMATTNLSPETSRDF